MTVRTLGINGMGRIGKLTVWRHIALGHFKRLVVNTGREVGKSVHDIAAYLESDSTYGPLSRYLFGFKGDAIAPVLEVVDEQKGVLRVKELGTEIVLLRRHRNPKDIEWEEHGVEIVVDTTGKFLDPTKDPDADGGSLRGHLEAGARKVINSAAFKFKGERVPEDAITMIYGINHAAYDPSRHHVISAASCTTTALAHMMKPLLEHPLTKRLLTASMSTIHAATNSQSVLDSVPKSGAKDLRKNRMVFDNIILTSTNAARALETVIEQIKDIGFMADSVRIPTSTVSLITLNVTIQSEVTEDGESTITREVINNIYKEASEGAQKGLLKYSEVQRVSTDYKGVDAAVVIEAHDTHTRTAFLTISGQMLGLDKDIRVPVTHVKIFGWYDNELGSYTNRLADLTIYIDEQGV